MDGVILDGEKWWSTTQVAKGLGVTDMTVRRWCHAGFIPYVRLGRLIRIADSDLRKFVERVKAETRQAADA